MRSLSKLCFMAKRSYLSIPSVATSAWNANIRSSLSRNSCVHRNICKQFCTSSAVFVHEQCELTHKRYPVKRRNFNCINEDDLTFFKSVVGDSNVLTSDLDGYNTDWLCTVRGESSVVLRPRTTEHVSQILKHCNGRRLAVCPQGGNTGLVGGSVPVFDEVILSTERMNKIVSVDELSGVLICQAGCILSNLDEHLEQFDLMMPFDLGAKGSCHIGGNISTNAGGLRLLRYGSLQGTVLGVEAVLANGEVLDCQNSLRKDNTGYHLHHLFIGAEGTLGIVTKLARSMLGEILCSCEFIDGSSMECVTTNLQLKLPISEAPAYILIEAQGSNSEHDLNKLEYFLEKAMDGGETVIDGVLTGEPSRMAFLWQFRERIAEAVLHEGYVFKYDISLPFEEFYNLVLITRARMGDSCTRCCGYGHLGDGNLHLNVTIPHYDKALAARLEPWIFEESSKLRGSISAEHGLGFKKRNFIHLSKSPSAVVLMKQLKQLMDPNGILNPYKVLPED